VHVQDIQYMWNSEDLAVVSVSPRSCKACAFYEDRKFPLKKVNGPVADASLHKPNPVTAAKDAAFHVWHCSVPYKLGQTYTLFLARRSDILICFSGQSDIANRTLSNLTVALACRHANCSFSGLLLKRNMGHPG